MVNIVIVVLVIFGGIYIILCGDWVCVVRVIVEGEYFYIIF